MGQESTACWLLAISQVMYHFGSEAFPAMLKAELSMLRIRYDKEGSSMYMMMEQLVSEEWPVLMAWSNWKEAADRPSEQGTYIVPCYRTS